MTTEKSAKAAIRKSPLKKTSVPVKTPAKLAVKATPKSALLQPEKKIKKESKVKVVRDSFTMPQSEYMKIAEIKTIFLKAKMHVKKSEILRAGLKVLAELNPAQLKLALNSLEKIKTGRPKKH